MGERRALNATSGVVADLNELADMHAKYVFAAKSQLRIDGLKREAVRMDQSDNGLAKPGNVIAMKGAA